VNAAVSARVPPAAFVRALWAEVEQHPALTHPFLHRFAEGRLARWQIWGYASQHYQLVCSFTAYPEAIAGRTPDPEVRRLLRDILEDEYMRPQAFERSHPALYRRFMRAVGFEEGAWDRVPVLPATRSFVATHLDMTFRSWMEALGAVRPGHEWAIPRMFPSLVQGIERSVAVPAEALEYFRLHIDLDVEHGRALEAALLRWATTDANQEDLQRGARRSLDARAAFWNALAEQRFPKAPGLGAEGSERKTGLQGRPHLGEEAAE
jgi:pyrroloquinoline-quinone synthase